MPITHEEFQKIPDGQTFATGVLPDSPEGINMTNSGKNLRWIAKKGYANDWTIYCHWEKMPIDWIEAHGDKVTSNGNILRCMPYAGDILTLYRY